MFHRTTASVQTFMTAMPHIMVAAFCGCLLIATGCTNPLQQRLDDFQQAANRGDVETALSFVHPDFEVTDAQSKFHAGLDRLRWELEYGDEASRTWNYTDRAVQGDTIVSTLVQKDDVYKLLGVDEVRYRVDVRFQDELIREIRYLDQLGGQKQFAKAQREFISWARRKWPDQTRTIYPKDSSANGRQSAKRWMSLLEVWHQQRRPNSP